MRTFLLAALAALLLSLVAGCEPQPTEGSAPGMDEHVNPNPPSKQLREGAGAAGGINAN